MQNWIEDVYNSMLRLYQNLVARGERVYIWGNVVDVILALMRNGIVYLFLMGSVLKWEIQLNRIDIRKYNYHDYLQLFSVVFQDFKLLSFELGQNVASSMNVDADRAEQCLRDAGFEIRVDKLPQGLSTAI